MRNDQIEAVAEALWIQSWNSCIGPLPRTGNARKQILERARELVAIYERSKNEGIEPRALARGRSLIAAEDPSPGVAAIEASGRYHAVE